MKIWYIHTLLHNWNESDLDSTQITSNMVQQSSRNRSCCITIKYVTAGFSLQISIIIPDVQNVFEVTNVNPSRAESYLRTHFSVATFSWHCMNCYCWKAIVISCKCRWIQYFYLSDTTKEPWPGNLFKWVFNKLTTCIKLLKQQLTRIIIHFVMISQYQPNNMWNFVLKNYVVKISA